MATPVTPNPVDRATATPDATATARREASPGVGGIPDSLRVDSSAAGKSQSSCAQICAQIDKILDSIISCFLSLCSKLKGLFVTEKAPNPPGSSDDVTPSLLSTLQSFKTVITGELLSRNDIVNAFHSLSGDIQELVKFKMWNLAGELIDPANPQLHDRQGDNDWAGRVIHNEVRISGESEDRADIAHHADLSASAGLFRRAIDAVIDAVIADSDPTI